MNRENVRDLLTSLRVQFEVQEGSRDVLDEMCRDTVEDDTWQETIKKKAVWQTGKCNRLKSDPSVRRVRFP